MWLPEDLYSKCLNILVKVNFMMLNESVFSYFLQKLDMEVASWTFYRWLTEATRNRELIYSSQKSTKIFGRKLVDAPKSTKKNGRWRHLNITILELCLTTQRARKVDMAAILDLNNTQNARKIASYMAKDT